MLKILIANQNNKQNLQYNKFLTENGYNVKSTFNSKTTLEMYKELEPSILILDYKLTNITKVIDKLSFSALERKKCNIILTVNKNEKINELENICKINRIFYKPIYYVELLKQLELMKSEYELKDITDDELNYYLLPLNFSINSNGCIYLKSAISHYYYYPKRFNSLNDIYILISSEYNITPKEVKYAIRNSLVSLNNYRNSIKGNSILKLFDETRDITPKYFLDIFVTYLRIKKIRNNLFLRLFLIFKHFR